MFSFERKLISQNTKLSVDAENLCDLPPELILHVVILIDGSMMPYQVLYTGDRVVDIELLREQIGVADLTVDSRFCSFLAGSNYKRIAPLVDEQGCSTFIDESLMFKKEVHVANGGAGYWIKSSDLRRIFASPKFIHVSRSGSCDGMDISASSTSFSKSIVNQKSLERHLKDTDFAISNLMFRSSHDEMLLIRSDSSDYDLKELESLIKIDISLYSQVMDYYFSIENAPVPGITIPGVLCAVGGEEIVNLLTGMSLSSKTFFADDIGLTNGSFIFECQLALSYLMRRVVELLPPGEHQACPVIAENIGRLALSHLYQWINVVGREKYMLYVELQKVNPHRFQTELQEIVSGFNQQDVARILLEANGYPSVYINALENFNTPFYSGEDSFYANLLYVLSSTLVEDGIVPSWLFSSIHNIHISLKTRMNITSQVAVAMEEVLQIIDSIKCQKWRFSSVKSTRLNTLNPECFIYRP